jgi:hypothetical protein
MTEVPLKAASLKEDDAFVLDAGSTVFVYQGPTCNLREKMKATQVGGGGKAGMGLCPARAGAMPVNAGWLLASCRKARWRSDN